MSATKGDPENTPRGEELEDKARILRRVWRLDGEADVRDKLPGGSA